MLVKDCTSGAEWWNQDALVINSLVLNSHQLRLCGAESGVQYSLLGLWNLANVELDITNPRHCLTFKSGVSSSHKSETHKAISIACLLLRGSYTLHVPLNLNICYWIIGPQFGRCLHPYLVQLSLDSVHLRLLSNVISLKLSLYDILKVLVISIQANSLVDSWGWTVKAKAMTPR